ncbi:MULTISPECIES: right-handed parallel beta-helix repeat-containing protein [unclassified Bradyrhizobium]|uniref:right-handed parallel beta-helix repeat-containing protein n=1 Tax=unclassified Bradyrhizobium TaxID=2631580 RepID=UPI001FF99560|nr:MULTISPECIES: right-handed parallel beta-helix repeat-containing protein [unclassified Bradyrhizobium]MCK1631815.1 right-handed parallel beta-helix repeat-containing protein [Bradyrhizobium sp. 162]MCK1676455.1 right-handed parallel beta-helix repeat-containing protein [Bradyrhizobium sp. 150]
MVLVSRRSFLMMIAAIDAQRAQRDQVRPPWEDVGHRVFSERATLAADSRNAALKYPDETSTGVMETTNLPPSGPVTTTGDGQLIRGLDISGAVQINHSAVTLEHCRITAAVLAVVNVAENLSVPPIIQDCEIDGLGVKGAEGSNGINGYGTIRRCNIHGVENGINVTAPLLFEDNYVHDLVAPGSPHYDGVQIDGGHDINVRHNTIINSHAQTSAIMIDNWFNAISNVVVDNNRLIGGGFTVYSDAQFSGGSITGVSFTNNRMGKGRWGYATFRKNRPVWRGNVDDVSGRAI